MTKYLLFKLNYDNMVPIRKNVPRFFLCILKQMFVIRDKIWDYTVFSFFPYYQKLLFFCFKANIRLTQIPSVIIFRIFNCIIFLYNITNWWIDSIKILDKDFGSTKQQPFLRLIIIFQSINTLGIIHTSKLKVIRRKGQ